jgi:hypothetical protein
MPIGRITKKSRQRQQLILAMLHQPTLEKAAETAGISSATAWRIRTTPEFKKEYRVARRECYSQTFARLQQLSSAAVSVLAKIMVDVNMPSACRVRAAYIILALTVKGIEIEDLEARVSELEEAAETTNSGNKQP